MKKWVYIILVCMGALALMCGCSQDASTAPSVAQNSSVEESTARSSAQDTSAKEGEASAATESEVSTGAEGERKTYTITRVDQAPDWSAVPQLDIDKVQWTDDYGIRAHAQLCYDSEALYVRMWAEEQDVRATYTTDDPLPKCYEDSCLEFFFQLSEKDARYMNFEFNPNAALCCEIGTEKQNRVVLVPPSDALTPTANRTDDGWDLTYRLPFEFLRMFYPEFSAEPGVQIRGNLYKCGNLTAHKHYLSWNPVESDTPNFHLPSSFGVLVFG